MTKEYIETMIEICNLKYLLNELNIVKEGFNDEM